MSEFTDCIYLKTESLQGGVDWLKAAGLRGYLMRPVDGWLQVLPEWPYGRESIPNPLQATLVHYRFAADHLWSFEIYVGQTRVFRYACAWEDGNIFDLDGSLEVATRRLGVTKEELDEVLYTGDPEATYDELIESASRFCGLVGLPNYSWAEFGYVNPDGPAILVRPRQIEEEEPLHVDLGKLSGVLARLSISRLIQAEKIVLDPDSRDIRKNLARRLIDELDDTMQPNLADIAASWHLTMQRSPMVARFRFEPVELERLLENLVNHATTRPTGT